MTKRRPPGRLHDALNQALGTLTMAVAADVTGLSESHLRATTDPDKQRPLSLAAAVKIDRALVAAGEEPLLLRWFVSAVEDDNESAGRLSVLDCIARARGDVRRAMLATESQPADGVHPAREIGVAGAELATEVAMLIRVVMDLWDCQQQEPSVGSRRDSIRLVGEQ